MKEIKIKDVDVVKELLNAPEDEPKKKRLTPRELDEAGRKALRKFLSQRGMLDETEEI